MKAWQVIAVLTAAGASTAASGPGSGLPSRLAAYRSWKMTAEPRLLPPELTIQCAPMTAAPREEAVPRGSGPHTMRWIRTYANPIAVTAMRRHDRTAFPAGSIIVKEKLLEPADRNPEAVAFMIKHAKGKFTASGGWEFLYYPSTGPADSYEGCVTCHRVGAERDYVFGALDRDASRE